MWAKLGGFERTRADGACVARAARKADGPFRGWALREVRRGEFFSFLYLKKIKILKIYGRFEKFQNYTPVAPWLGDRN